jgi:hypothetical protein
MMALIVNQQCLRNANKICMFETEPPMTTLPWIHNIENSFLMTKRIQQLIYTLVLACFHVHNFFNCIVLLSHLNIF